MDATDLQLDLLGNGGDTLVRCLLVALIAYTLQMLNIGKCTFIALHRP